MTKPARNRSDIGRSNLARSKAMERQLVAYLRASGWPGADRTVRTGYRVAQRTSPDLGDITGTPGLVWQAKVVQDRRLSAVPQWLAETAEQRDAARADHGILVVRRAGHAHPATWWAFMELGALLRLAIEPHGGALPAPLLASVAPVRLELAALLPLAWAAGYGTRPDPRTAPDLAEEAS